MSSSNNPGSSSSKTVSPDDVTNLRRPRQSGSDSPGQGTGIETDPDTIHAEGQSIGGMNQLSQAEQMARAGSGGATGKEQGGGIPTRDSGTLQSTQSEETAQTDRTGQKISGQQPTSGAASSSDDRGSRGQHQKNQESTS